MKKKFSIAIILSAIHIVSFGQIIKSPKNLKKAVSYLNTYAPDSIKDLIKLSGDDTIKKTCYPYRGEYKTIFNWTDRDNYGSKIVKYLDDKGVSIYQTEVILIAFKEYLIKGKFDEEKIIKPFKNLELKWKEEDKVRYTTDSLKVEITKLTERDYTFNNYRFGIGLWIRNNWQLWGGSRLSKFFDDNKIYHPESMSSVILESYFRYLKNEDLRFEEQVNNYVKWDEKAKKDEKEREEEKMEENKETFNNLKIGDTLEYNYNHEFASQSQEDKWMDDSCIAKGILVEKNDKHLIIKVKVIESCDRKGIVIYNDQNSYIYNKETKQWSRPEKRTIKYLKKRKLAWFRLDDWYKEYKE
jgi:hypothetical protein